MIPVRVTVGVMVLAITVTCLASGHAHAAPSEEPGASPAAPTTSGTPLSLRPTRATPLSEEPSQPGLGWKLVALLLAGGIGLWSWRRSARRAPVEATHALRILRRLPIGVRSELIMVDVDGQRLLLGVTPNAIQNLFIAPLDDAMVPTDFSASHILDTPPEERASRRRRIATAPARKEPNAQVAARKQADLVEEQAHGIRSLLART